jgi:hypothetical protein
VLKADELGGAGRREDIKGMGGGGFSERGVDADGVPVGREGEISRFTGESVAICEDCS